MSDTALPRRIPPVAGRIGNRARFHSRNWHVRLSLAAAGLDRATRAALTSAGLPLRKQFLLLDCGIGEDASGLFSEVAAVIGAIEHYETWRGIYAGLEVNFRDHGLYHEPAVGLNWWDYYFEPIHLGDHTGALTRAVAPLEHDAFAYRVERDMPRDTAARIVRQHVRPRPSLHERVEHFWREHFAGGRVVGVHYRGTDKSEEAHVVPYDIVSAAIDAALQEEGPGPVRLFVATDEQAFLDHARLSFPGQVSALTMPRSADGRPLHKTSGGLSQGADAVVDCLLLARCDRVVRTASNLGLCATFFNPTLPVTLLERG